jgi:D-arabinose 1-dehydrogenase-like Zn-dependent alcohol dehydrogenase
MAGLVLLQLLMALAMGTVRSSLIGTASFGTLPQSKVDLWIVGAGTLGELVAKEWKERYPSATVIAETLSPQRHQALREIGAHPILRSER